ncbi:MAG: formylmethanofuran dehydrogenase subunit A [Hyphomicrobiales bacterium]|nr:formylmethanofuran dehydrogenase subunit A [Hyphomicrobiales bacterium]
MIRLRGGRVIDPAHGRDEIADVWIEDGRIVTPPAGGQPAESFDISGKIVMAGAIDIHSHIAGANVNTARLLLPEFHRAHLPRPGATPLTELGWSTIETGRLYAAMGFTTVVEPAVAPHTALHAHLELADTPLIDKAILAVLGNEDFLLALMREKEGLGAVRDYVSSMLSSSRALGVKVINAGAAMAFKHNLRSFGLDDVVPTYGVTSREIVSALQQAVHELGVPHPLHLHCNNLGLAGNVETALETIEAFDGLPIHLAHLQFYSYGTQGKRGFSSAAARLAEAVNAAKNVTIDVGQVMFGQTVTVSSDVLRQFAATKFAHPRKSVIIDGDGNGGGVVPMAYRQSSFTNAVQWAAGLELFLLVENPWRVFFTTDHPNGAPFTSYPELFALLMDRNLRAAWTDRLPKPALAMTTLPSLGREYTLFEIATMTRAAPAKLLGLKDRGHLAQGALADIAVYHDRQDRAEMFRAAHLVFKNGKLVVRDGKVTREIKGKTLHVTPSHDAAIDRKLDRYYEHLYGVPRRSFVVPHEARCFLGEFEQVPCVA